MSDIRDQIRAKVFSGENKPKREQVEFFGTTIELRQPTLAQVIEAQASEDRESAVIDMLVNRAFVPETDEHVFEDTDAAGLKALPFGPDFIRVSNAFEKMSDVNFRDGKSAVEKESSSTAGNEASLGTEED